MSHFKTVFRIVVILFGVALTANGLFLLLISNWNLGNIIVFVAGLFALFCGMFFNRLRRLTSHGIGRIIKYIVMFGILSMLGIMVFIGVKGQYDTADFKEDAVIVLGAGIHGTTVTDTLARRLDKCIEYASKNPSALIIVSGGKGSQEDTSEAFAMQLYLTAHGIDASRIVQEDKSTSTYENFLFSKAILDKTFSPGYHVAYITNRFHSYRAGLTAAAVGIDAHSYSAGLKWYLFASAYTRECLAVLYMWVFGV